MSLCVIELNDIDLLTSNAEGEWSQSPGYAWLNNAGIVVGEPARAVARRYPRQINNRYWQQLGLNSLPEQHALARHHADIAFQHLQQLHKDAGEPEQVIFAIPASVDREQLAVLLGITQQCSFDAVGLVDLAVASAASVELPGTCVHLDIQLHQAVISRCSLVDGSVALDQSSVLASGGLLALQNQCAHLIADAFIQQCRFDPLHDAESEQTLYDALPGWFHAASAAPELVFEIPQGATRHKAKLPRNTFLDPVRQLQRRIQAGIDGLSEPHQCVLVSYRLQELPGFCDQLEHCIPVSRTAAADACRQLVQKIRSDSPSLPFVTRLPARPMSTQVNVDTAVAATVHPAKDGGATHLEMHYTAYPLGTDALSLYADDSGRIACGIDASAATRATISRVQEQVWLNIEGKDPVYVNDEAVQQQRPLTKGDRLSLQAGNEYAYLIEVINGAQT